MASFPSVRTCVCLTLTIFKADKISVFHDDEYMMTVLCDVALCSLVETDDVLEVHTVYIRAP
jgi:hypothetical protein